MDIKKIIILICVLTNITFAQSTSKYFVYFKDKGIDENYALQKNSNIYQKAINSISARSIKRRIKTLGQNFITIEDLPIAENYLAEIEKNGIKIIRKLKWLNAISAHLTENQYQTLSKLNFVSKIEKVKKLKYITDQSVKTKLEKVNQFTNTNYKYDYGSSLTQYKLSEIPELHNIGISGSGVLIGILDAGFAWKSHPALDDKIVVGERDFVNGDFKTDDGDANHGTAVFSLIGGFDEGKIVAPAFNSQFALAKTEYIYSETNVEEDNYAAGLEWMDSIGVDITTTSLGYSEFDEGEVNHTYSDLDGKTTVVTKASELAFSRGIITINSAGNEGNSTWKYITAPADGFNTIAVGAVGSDTVLASFSSVGPTYDGRIKPEIVAQGVACYHAVAYSNTYGYGSGTSYSAPIAAGITAQLLSKFTYLTNSQVRLILIQASNNVENPDNLYGYGLLSARKAIEFPNVELFPNSDLFSINKLIIDTSGIFNDSLNMFYSLNSDADFMKISSKINAEGYFENNLSANSDDLISFYFEYRDSNLVKKRVPKLGVYELKSGSTEITLNFEVPIYQVDIELDQNFPNPFSLTTSIIVKSTIGTHLKVEIYNVLGQKVKTLFSGLSNNISTIISWNGTDDFGAKVASGVYLYKLVADDDFVAKKMIFIK